MMLMIVQAVGVGGYCSGCGLYAESAAECLY